MLHWHSPREDLIGVIALIVYIITRGSLSGGRNGSILDSHTIYFLSFGAFNLQESPLRIRGKALRLFSPHPQQRITPAHAGKRAATRQKKSPLWDHPAHAGKSTRWSRFCRRKWDHPRACGEKTFNKEWRKRPLGSPPRMRGKVGETYDRVSAARITPAHAGKSSCRLVNCRHKGDHPRACGEKAKKIPYHRLFPLRSAPFSFSFA